MDWGKAENCSVVRLKRRHTFIWFVISAQFKSLNLLGCVSACEINSLHILKGAVNAEGFTATCAPIQIVFSVKALDISARQCQLLNQYGFTVEKSCSPDLSAAENIWTSWNKKIWGCWVALTGYICKSLRSIFCFNFSHRPNFLCNLFYSTDKS